MERYIVYVKYTVPAVSEDEASDTVVKHFHPAVIEMFDPRELREEEIGVWITGVEKAEKGS